MEMDFTTACIENGILTAMKATIVTIRRRSGSKNRQRGRDSNFRQPLGARPAEVTFPCIPHSGFA